MTIWTNVGIFLIVSILWTMASMFFFPNCSKWVDILAGVIMMSLLIFFGYPLTQ